MAKRKCIICEKWIENNAQSIPYKGRYAHKDCFDIAMKTIKKDKDEKLAEKSKTIKAKKTTSKPKAELKEAMSEEEYAEKKQYYQYLRSLIDDELTAKVYALSDQYVTRYNFTFKEMYQTLVYLHEIVEKELVGEVVGLIPFYYNEAQNYFKNIDQIEKANKNINIKDMYKERIITIRPKQRIVKQIDIESIGGNKDD